MTQWLFARRIVALASLCAGVALTAFAAPPVAPVRDTPQTYHGVTLHDPYRYMENVRDPEVKAWLLSQGTFARAALDRIAGRDKLEQRIAQLSAASGDTVRDLIRMPGERIFYLKRPARAKQARLMMRVGLHGAERLLVNPEVQAAQTGVPHSINYFVPSWDGQHVAFGMSAGGSEDASLYVLNVTTGKLLGAPIARVREPNVSWTPDSQFVSYNQLKVIGPEDAETETYLDSRVMLLKVGAPEASARAVFGPTVTPQLGLARLDVGSLLFTPGSPWVVARTTDTTLPEGSLFVAKVSELERGGAVAWRQVASFEDRVVDIELRGDDLYMRTFKGAPRYKVMKLDLRTPVLANAVDVAQAPQDGVIEGFALTRDGLIAAVRESTAIGLRRYPAGDREGRAMKMPFVGAAGLLADPAHVYGDVLYSMSGWTQPERIFQLNGEVSVDTRLQRVSTGSALTGVVVEEYKVPSHDGALVPMTVLYRKGLKRDGSNPTLLDGYGAYGFSETAHFDPASMAWLERGGVLAFANVRGSGVYGEPWRAAGFKSTKPNTWKDGIACAQYLIAQGFASPRTLAVTGGSAGGIFAGRVVTTAPQLFAAAVFNVGTMDSIRSEESANGITNISEFGTVKKPDEFRALLEMSTYHHIQDATAYPAVMFVHGLNDPRVEVWESAKAAARFQAATASAKPVLLRLDAQAGHGIGSTATQRHAMRADIYSFLLWQMGKTQQAP
ncbi:prolyl oligopeptidase family serine peptidase [Caenimonas koreensis DSM 17982]|uniref:prolyl oligopeptidase n=1 Tax=Caenimonas koreensis DSM 17982 TaxID=1121255 RepID=A0A844B185_9BURK|nr:prolyl oligopeptidase family serine peptidase [Caenimonas koreensis]MRD46893.1 prolyl oligopeptidase family serine peptidase [Caenimonas koreensis DSM 17982]